MKILNYNIEYGGFEKHINFIKYVKMIKDEMIDIFIATEPNQPTIKVSDSLEKDSLICADYSIYGKNTIEMVADELNKTSDIPYYYITTDDKSVTIISKYIIKKTNNSFVFDIIYAQDTIIKLIPIHLIDYPFTFYTLRSIPYQNTPSIFKSKNEIVDLSYSTKSDIIEQILEYIKNNSNEKIIIAGDFNEPSHLDDINNVWIISKKFSDIGMIDSYRHVNKKISRDAYGYNTDGGTCCNILLEDEPLNRVDYIYTKNLEPVKSYVLKKYAHYSDHLPVLTEIKDIDSMYKQKYMKYKIKYTLLKREYI
jgi:hypothetical protein